MNSIQKLLAAFALEASSVILSLTTGILGAAGCFLQLRFLNLRQFVFIQLATICIFVAFGLYPLAVLVLALGSLTTVYIKLENENLFWRGFWAASVSTAILCLGFFIWAYYFQEKNDVWLYLKETIQSSLDKTQNSNLPIDLNVLVYQLPSYCFCICALNVWIGSVFRIKDTAEHKNYKTPDGLIWFVIVALLFSFVKVDIPGLQEVALNVLNITLLLYFFQGLSVLSFILDAMRFSTLIKLVIYFIFVFQILLPICLGILDYWLDLRLKIEEKLNKKPEDEEF